MRLGILTLQATDKSDVFLREDVVLDGIISPEEGLAHIPEPGFDEQYAWVSGKAPEVIPVTVEGDTGVIYGWFKGESFFNPFILRVYVEYEEAEETEDDGNLHTATDTTAD